MTSVAICIPTYRRPELLENLLRSLTTLDTKELDVRVVVVDNDAAGLAAPVVRRFVGRLSGLTYEVEPSRGLATVRNRLVAIAGRLGVEYVAFVDDDEWVEPGWLAGLVRTARACGADAVGGPVLPEYDDGTPRWVALNGFFDRRRHRTGQAVRLDATGNLLLKQAWLDRLDGPFDRRLDLTGGEDHQLLERLHRLGARMTWCNEAVVHERIPRSRATMSWLVRRAFRGGVGFSEWSGALDPGPGPRARRVGKALARAAWGLASLPPSLLMGRAATVRALCHGARGVGGVLGVCGLSYREYERVHGR